ncbi:hypothetical protein BsIDN1_41680 [Bacillus safensis]|uniref:EamA domain-containing protein n=1 Tax=Bacillus safensis TaxID=561879 RepID=A0A5S9MAJ3_BACIA|nr:hypothetical protein BsIDN1_41680 [Bacillus safensis]
MHTLPAIFWGSIVLISVKLGGNAYQQTLGITLGAFFIFDCSLFFIKMPELTPLIFFAVSVISGIFWSIGQMNQLSSVAFLGVSKAVPLSTGMQLVSTTLFGVMVFKEWQTMTVILIGSCAILLIIAGVVMTSLGQKKKRMAAGMAEAILKRDHYSAHLNCWLRRICRHFFKMV